MNETLNKIPFISDRINGQVTTNSEEIPKSVREAIACIICSHIDNHGLQSAFLTKLKGFIPNLCHIHSVNNKMFEYAIKKNFFDDKDLTYDISYLDILDTIQFCHEYIPKSIGKENFMVKINQLFARNAIAFELEINGNIKRYNPIVSKIINETNFHTVDEEFNNDINKAIKKFFDKDKEIHKESIDTLWGSFECLKSFNANKQGEKKDSITKILDDCTDDPNFRRLLEEEADALRDIGNNFRIRHKETYIFSIKCSKQVDYFFIRLLAFIKLCIESLPKEQRA